MYNIRGTEAQTSFKLHLTTETNETFPNLKPEADKEQLAQRSFWSAWTRRHVTNPRLRSVPEWGTGQRRSVAWSSGWSGEVGIPLHLTLACQVGNRMEYRSIEDCNTYNLFIILSFLVLRFLILSFLILHIYISITCICYILTNAYSLKSIEWRVVGKAVGKEVGLIERQTIISPTCSLSYYLT